MVTRPPVRTRRWLASLIIALFFMAVAASAAVGWWYARESPAHQGPIVLVSIDGIPATDLRAYGAERSDTPAIDELDEDFAGLDRQDLERAAGEGRGTAPGAPERRSASTMNPDEGLLSPLDGPRENSGIGLTGVMADPAATGARTGFTDAEGASANGVGTSSDRYAG